jgi:serine/threonine protein kinase/Tfp pilus assembly protein PilF
MSLQIGQQLGSYEITGLLGKGGMGEVYLAHDSRLNRKVALKVFPSTLVHDDDRLRRFDREAQAASGLNHPNIITIYEIGEENGTHFIATEFVDGETLRAKSSKARIDPVEVVNIAIQIAVALDAAHRNGIVHRDIKPDNIMLRRDGVIKVLDFGLAKLTEKQEEGASDSDAATLASVATRPGMVMGTVAYMSPEQARGLTVDTRTDIFSLGVVLYEMLTGRLPHCGETASDQIAAILKTPAARLTEFNQSIPIELERIVNKTLVKDREDRYQTAIDLLVDLRRLRRQFGIQTEGLVRPVPSWNAAYITAQIRKHTLRFAAIIAALLLASIGMAYWFLSSRSSNLPQIESIAVLPFVNESGNADVEYLSDGMTESLITDLSEMPKLNVKARASVFRYKGKEIDLRKAGVDLSVTAILLGRLVQRGDNLALHIELVDAKTENALWKADYDRPIANLVRLQGEIARDVATKLRARLSGAEAQRVAKNYTENVEAYQLYMKGRYHLAKLNMPETQKAVLYFQQAIEVDPAYALAYVGLATAYRSFSLSFDMPAMDFLPRAKAAARRAIELDDGLAEAHAVLGFTIFWYDWNQTEAENQFRRALDLNPNSADAHWGYGHLLSNMGRHAEALAEAKRARELDPLSVLINAGEGLFLVQAGRVDEALDRLQKTFELDANSWLAHLFASEAYIDKGAYAEAIAEAHKARELNGSSSMPIAYRGYALAKSGKRAEAQADLEELLKLATKRYVPPSHVALLYIGLDNRDETLQWLERGYQQRDPKMTFLKVQRNWDSLRNDQRFQDLLRRVGLMP